MFMGSKPVTVHELPAKRIFPQHQRLPLMFHVTVSLLYLCSHKWEHDCVCGVFANNCEYFKKCGQLFKGTVE